jgi:DNA polymerase-3 subunit delta'
MAFTAAEALSLLKKACANNRLAHAYLVTGPEGSGTREVAEGLAGILTGEAAAPLQHPDVHVFEPESKSRRISIGQIRDLERELQMRSLRGGRKVSVIFDADRLGEQAANAFLKTLEEPPANSHIILVSTLPEQLLETILSRCIEVPLKPGPRQGRTPRQQRLADLLDEFSKVERPDFPRTLLLVREFQAILAEAKEVITSETEAAFEAEEKRYRETSGVDRDWIDDRQAYFKALAEARYRNERDVLLDTLESWWGDVLRQQHGVRHLDLPDFSRATAVLAQRHPTPQVLLRSGAIGALRENFGRGAQEQLALEVAFLDAFAP